MKTLHEHITCLGLNKRRAALKAGLNPSTVGRHLAGGRIGPDAMDAYHAHLGIPLDDLHAHNRHIRASQCGVSAVHPMATP